MAVGSLDSVFSGDRLFRRINGRVPEFRGVREADTGPTNLDDDLDDEDIFDDEEGDDYGGLDDELDEEFDEEFEDEPDADLDDADEF